MAPGGAGHTLHQSVTFGLEDAWAFGLWRASPALYSASDQSPDSGEVPGELVEQGATASVGSTQRNERSADLLQEACVSLRRAAAFLKKAANETPVASHWTFQK